MENSKMPVSGREIGVIVGEINELWRQAQSMALTYAVEIGRRLVEAKSVLKHGEWGKWIAENVSFSQSAANSFMQLFEEYGSAQITLFGAVSNSQTLGNLPYSKALALLAVPSEEREKFAEEVHAEDISVRDLKKAIAERNEAVKKAEAAEKARAEYEKQAAEAKAARDEAEAKAAQYATEANVELVEELRTKLQISETGMREAAEHAHELRAKLEEAEKNPKVPEEMLESLRKTVRAEVRGEIGAQMQTELEAAKKALEDAEAKRLAAEKESRAAAEKLSQAEKQLKTASPDVTAFKTLFEQLQDDAKKLRVLIAKISAEDEQTAGKLKGALASFGESLTR